ncbi:MAG: bifunctional aldolase/short-chain dehydrogenase [Bacillota bacterium]
MEKPAEGAVRLMIMRSLYNEEEAKKYIKRYAGYPEDLALRIYTSHLIGREGGLVLHGGGNTSVKSRVRDIFGNENDVLFVKGSGWDLAAIEPQGFPCLDLEYLRRLRSLERMSDEEMVNQLRTHMTDAASPDPSVETLLHAYLPHKFVDHTHADAVLILTNQKEHDSLLNEALGERVAVLEFIMPGFPLAGAVYELYEKNPDVEAIVLLNHGLFTFGDDAKTSYERTIKYVTMAEEYIASKTKNKTLLTRCTEIEAPINKAQAASITCQAVRGALAHAGSDGRLKRFILEVRDAKDIIEASLSQEAPEFCVSGLLTPDHVIRTKGKYVYADGVDRDDETISRKIRLLVEQFKKEYNDYFDRCVREKNVERKRLDPYPRVFLVAGVGIIAAGKTRKAAGIAADLAEHTIRAKVKARALGEYVSLPDHTLFDMEYWSLEQKKLGRSGGLSLEGQVAFVSGGGGAMAVGIGDRLLAAGAALVLSDINAERLDRVKKALSARYDPLVIETLVMDVTDYDAVAAGLDRVCRILGGIDIVVPNAGIAHVARIEHLEADKLEEVMRVNFLGVFNLIKAAAGIFKRQGTGGNIVVNCSKNVFDPGPAFGAYSASKAAAHQISKIAALELATLGVKVNMINADAVFGAGEISSGLWDVVGPDRMKARGLDPQGLQEYYRERNLLKTEVFAEHVGNAVVFFAADQTPTTGATLPVDGGIPAAFPR